MDQSVILSACGLNLYYGENHALKDISIDIKANKITALIGPSGCGKSTFLRTIDRMNEPIPSVKITGSLTFHGQEIYAPGVDVTDLRRRIGMLVFVAVALLAVLHKGNRSLFTQYSKGMLGVIAVNVAYTLLVPNISVSGHLGGALGGLVAMFMIPAASLRVPNPVRVVVAVLWVAALVWLLVSQGVLGV